MIKIKFKLLNSIVSKLNYNDFLLIVNRFSGSKYADDADELKKPLHPCKTNDRKIELKPEKTVAGAADMCNGFKLVQVV